MWMYQAPQRTRTPQNPSLEDSGYNDSLGLHCDEDADSWKHVKAYISPGGRQCSYIPAPPQTSTKSSLHEGFEEHLDTIYQHRLSIEYKFQVASCLDNQPEVQCTVLFCLHILVKDAGTIKTYWHHQ